MPTTVCPIADSHAASFRACLDGVAREKSYLAQLEAPPLERVEAFVRESVKNGAAQYVALDDGVVVGWCDILPDWPAALAHCGHLGMGVASAYRAQGLGLQLITATLAHAKRQGLLRVGLEVRADNLAAVRLYERVGFVHEGRQRHRLQYDGVTFDALVMGLLFDAASL